METMTPTQAKKLVANKLAQSGLMNKLQAKTVSFEGRREIIFVKIKDWKPSPLANELDQLAKANGFAVEYAGSGFIS